MEYTRSWGLIAWLRAMYPKVQSQYFPVARSRSSGGLRDPAKRAATLADDPSATRASGLRRSEQRTGCADGEVSIGNAPSANWLAALHADKISPLKACSETPLAAACEEVAKRNAATRKQQRTAEHRIGLRIRRQE